jgi:hypothetical protein
VCKAAEMHDFHIFKILYSQKLSGLMPNSSIIPPLFVAQHNKEPLNGDVKRFLWAVLDLFRTAFFLILAQMRVIFSLNLNLKTPKRQGMLALPINLLVAN